MNRALVERNRSTQMLVSPPILFLLQVAENSIQEHAVCNTSSFLKRQLKNEAMGSDARAREKYRNALFEREAKAATSLLEQVRQYVGRAGKCHVSDFEARACSPCYAVGNL